MTARTRASVATTNPEQYGTVSDSRVAWVMGFPADERIRAPIIGAYDGQIVSQSIVDGLGEARGALDRESTGSRCCATASRAKEASP